MSAPMDSGARGLGVALILAVVNALVLAGVLLAVLAPPSSVARELVGPMLIAAGVGLGARVVFVQVRAARRTDR